MSSRARRAHTHMLRRQLIPPSKNLINVVLKIDFSKVKDDLQRASV